MDINRISAIVNKNYLRGNRFRVQIAGAPQVVNENCCAVQFPGTTYGTFPWRNGGPAIKMPYDVIFDELTIEFYSDAQGQVSKWLRQWNKSVVGDNFRFSYFADYVKDVLIEELNQSNQPVERIQLKNAYPTSVQPVQLSFEGGDQIGKISVVLVYEYKTE